MMNNYYFVATSLPALQLTQQPDPSFNELVSLFKINLAKRDYEKTQIIRLFYDIQNIRSLWKLEPLDPRGNFNKVELEDALISRVGLPSYVNDFLDRYESLEQRLHHFSALTSAYFKHEEAKATGFLQKYLHFERAWRLVLTACRAKRLGRDLAAELQFEDPSDDLVAQLLAQKDAPLFIAPNGYEELVPLFEEHADSPLGLHQALTEYRFRNIAEMTGIDQFSIDYLLNYMTQIILVEKWLDLDRDKAKKIRKPE